MRKRDELHDAVLMMKLATSLWNGAGGVEKELRASGWRRGQQAELGRIQGLVVSGVPSSLALALYRKGAAGEQVYEIVRAAEDSGDFRSSLIQASNVLVESSFRRKSATAALTYPFVILMALGCAAAFLASTAGPHLLDSYAAFALEPPRALRAVVTAAAALRTTAQKVAVNPRTWPALVTAIPFTAHAIRRWWRNRGREVWERLAWAIPLIGSATRQRIACNFLRWFAACLALGVPVETALSSAGRSCGSLRARRDAISLAPSISKGVPLGVVLARMKWLPPELRETVDRVQDSRQWREMVDRSAAILDRMADIEARIGYALLEPFLVACLGVGVLVLALLFVIPISSLAAEVTRL